MSDIHDDAAEEEVALVETLPIHSTYVFPTTHCRPFFGVASSSICALGGEKVLELPVIGNS